MTTRTIGCARPSSPDNGAAARRRSWYPSLALSRCEVRTPYASSVLGERNTFPAEVNRASRLLSASMGEAVGLVTHLVQGLAFLATKA